MSHQSLLQVQQPWSLPIHASFRKREHHARSAAAWPKRPRTEGFNGSIRSPVQKLSKYTCHQWRSCTNAWSNMSENQGGRARPRTTWFLGSNWWTLRIFSEISCMIPTLDNQPIGITAQANASSSEPEQPNYFIGFHHQVKAEISLPNCRQLEQMECTWHIWLVHL